MVNHLVFQGRLTKDLEMKQTPSGISNIAFTLAWNEKYKENEDKCFLRCKAWRQTAEFIDRYFHDKGSEMTVEGKLSTEEWTDKEGNQRSQIVLNVDKVHFCGRRQNAQNTPQTQETPQAVPVQPDGDLPF